MNESRIGALITEAYAVRVAKSMNASMHAQHAATILVGLDAEVTVKERDREVRARIVVVPPDREHAVQCPGPTLTVAHDPEVARHVAGFSRMRGHAFAFEGRIGARLLDAVTSHRASIPQPAILDGLARESSSWLTGERPPQRPDRRVARLLEVLRDPLVDRNQEIQRLGISLAHLQALFARDVGLPIRTYQLWRRALLGVMTFARHDASASAHAAGFADLAHFSRTCRRMFGDPPTTLGRSLLLS